MKRLLVWLLGIVALLVIGPPLWFTVLPQEAPSLDPPARAVALADGTRVNVVEAGAGPPVILVHGLPGTAGDWRVTTEALAARGHRVYAYDRVGYGHSDPRMAGPHTPERNAQDLIELMDALGVARARVVGWSYGGVTSMIAARETPERFESLVLVGSGGPDSPDAQPPQPNAAMRFLYSDPVLAWRGAVPPVGRGLISALSGVAFSDGPMPDWWIPSVQANFARRETLLTYRGEMFAIPPEDGGRADLRLESIRVPTLVLHGDDDRLAPVSIGRYLASAIPGAKLREFPNASHMLPVTHADALADAIASFP